MRATTRRRRRSLWLSGAFGLTSLVSLASCATLGGNVRGSFSCSAPDGICAPSSTIDDRALALISDDPSDGVPLPAGNYRQQGDGRSGRVAALQPARLAAVEPGRTQEKVLRIVFQPYIDERGRLHEASAVHAVVARGEWQQAILQSGGARRVAFVAPGGSEALAEAVDRVDPPADTLAVVDPNAPDPAAVAAARARKADPVEAIKADVAKRLAPRRRASSTSRSAETVSSPPPAAAPKALHPPSGASTGGSPQDKTTAAQGAQTGAAGQAVARVKADPRYTQVANGAARDAKEAAAQSGAQPAPTVPGTAVKAASFPAAVPEDR